MTNATITPVHETEVVIEREFDAPRDLVWETITDPELVPRWWGPARHTTKVVEMDLRPGGRWRFESFDDDGTMYGFSGEYREIAAPELLEQTFAFDLFPEGVSIERATYTELDGGRTRMSVRVSYSSKEMLDGMLASGMEDGMNETYDRLDVLLAERLDA